MKLLGSHNSLTYLKPKKWYLKPLAFMAKCQGVDYRSQYQEHNIRLFDLRICFNKKNALEVRHGMMVYDISENGVLEFINFLNTKGDCYVRIILEENNIQKKKSYAKKSEECFIAYCEFLEKSFPDVKFFCGRRKYDWKCLYQFKNNEVPMLDMYSSTTRLIGNAHYNNFFSKFKNIADDWFPAIYAKTHNKKNYKEFMEKEDKESEVECLLFDFVHIR